MRFLMYTEVLPSDFRWEPSKPLGGTPEFYARTAQETVSMSPDNEVLVVYDGPLWVPDDGRLVYLPREDAKEAIPEFDPDRVMICNYGRRHVERDFADATFCLMRDPVYWTNHYEDEPDPIGKNTVVSEFHRRQLLEAGDIHTRVVPHGVDHDKYRCDPKDKRKLCLFSSSYDRGGAYLEDLWRTHRIRERTGYELHVTSYGRNHGVPGALGGISEEEMTDLYKEASFWLHPGHGVELFCLAGVKAQAAGCTPVIVPNMALAETVKWGYRFSEGDYAKRLIQVLNNGMTVASNADHIPSWAEATRMLWEDL